MLHNMKLNPMPFEAIKAGVKTIEIRLNDEKRRQVKVGDVIVFSQTDSGEELIVDVIALHAFATFRELYEKFTPEVCGSPYRTIEERLADTYKSYYTKEREQKWGVLGIGVKFSDAEVWDLYDEMRQKTGLLHRRNKPIPQGYYHLVVDIWTVNKAGEVLITRRAPNKTFAGQWECQGGSAHAGEDSLSAALREAKEESGLTLNPDNAILAYEKEPKDACFGDVWLFRQEYDMNDVRLQESETVDAKKATYAEIISMIERGEFVAHLRERLDKVFEIINKDNRLTSK